ncbi:RNA-binding ATPase activator esf2 [Entomortierella chlamydospora]|uniref:18S rRNA factor 2 n=1 Tax=Entomortierella chlamydospora TaxID=101097 RepID=A0A9P6SXK3_9FUNG|nr:RNA-binding ATPase activator esf2 [Entomortierella chlamydospora]KAG0010182.1 RNA-binding ATPase activator esf2 [Entomortierella chlamydospora]
MSAKLRTEDIFNLPEEDAHSDGSAYDSEEEQGSKGPSAKSKASKKAASKKKKSTAVFGLDQDMGSEDDNDYSSQEEEGDNEESNEVETADQKVSLDSRFQINDEEGDGAKTTRVRGTKKSKKVKPLTPEALEKFQAARDKTGIVYLSKIPPFMKPVKLRHLLGQFGELGRVYLAPEDAKVAARRKKYGGNKKQNFTEGWVEFLDKTVAKQVAKSLNTTIIGGNKNSYYHDDMWNIKYLPKFKWDHLTERIAYENASRAQRLQAEISQAKRENKFILNNIEKSKMIKNMEEKKAAKRKAAESKETNGGAGSESGEVKIRRTFKQRRLGGDGEVGTQAAKAKAAPVQGKIKSVLGSVFGR